MKYIIFLIVFAFASSVYSQSVRNDKTDANGKYKNLVTEIKLSGKEFKEFRKEFDGKTDCGSQQARTVGSTEIPGGYWVIADEEMPDVANKTENGIQVKVSLKDLAQAGKSAVSSPILYVWKETNQSQSNVSTNNNSASNNSNSNLKIGTKICTDKRDSNEYAYVQIGNQWWMAENLRYDADESECFNESNCRPCGRLYTYESATDACPIGWRLPSKEDYNELIQFVKSKNSSVMTPGKDLETKYGFSVIQCNTGTTQRFWTSDIIDEGGNNELVTSFLHLNLNFNENSTSENKKFAVRCIGDNGNEDPCIVQESKEEVIVTTIKTDSIVTKTVQADKITTTQDWAGETFKDDRDGQTYKVVTINGQTWMAQNMNYKTENSFCYDDKIENADIYGRLYTVEAALNVCPTGWHLPTAKEWNQLSLLVGHNNFSLKEKGIEHWKDKNPSTDKYNFSVLPGGYLWGTYHLLGEAANFWTSEKKDNYGYYYVHMKYTDSKMYFEKEMNYGMSGFSVRCVKNE